jgi:hypothetical protein
MVLGGDGVLLSVGLEAVIIYRSLRGMLSHPGRYPLVLVVKPS